MSMPLHPIVVHFPIALLTVGTVFLLIALLKKPFFEKAALLVLGIGFVSGIISFITGEGAEEFAEEQGKMIEALVETHETLALISLVLFGLSIAFIIARRFIDKSYLLIISAIVAVIGSVTLLIAGHYGGRMVYELGTMIWLR